MGDKQYVYLYIISKRNMKDELEGELRSFGGALINCVFGRGYYESRTIFDYFGFANKKGKAIITSLIEREKSIELIKKLNDVYGFAKENTGIAFSVPVDKIVY